MRIKFSALMAASLLAGCEAAESPQNLISNEVAPVCQGRGISETLEAVAAGNDASARLEGLDMVVAAVRTSGADCVSQKDIDVLGRLVGDDESAIRSTAAFAIFTIGPKARSTIPALREALTREPCDTTGSHPAGTITSALEKLGGLKRGERLCGTSKSMRE